MTLNAKAPGRWARHHVLKDVVARVFASAGFPVSKQSADGKRPDGMTLIPWEASSLWCDCHLHVCGLICRGIGTRVRRRSKNCSHAQRGQVHVFQSTATVHLSPNSHWDAKSSQWDCSRPLVWRAALSAVFQPSRTCYVCSYVAGCICVLLANKSYHNSVGASQHVLVTTVKDISCSNGFQFACSDLMQFWTTVFVRGPTELMATSAIFSIFLKFLKHLGLCPGFKEIIA